jgi:hypothetical protein
LTVPDRSACGTTGSKVSTASASSFRFSFFIETFPV